MTVSAPNERASDSPPRPARRLGSTARIWLLSAIMGCVAVVMVLIGLPAEPPLAPPYIVPWPLIALAVYIAEVKVVHLHIGRSAHSFSMSELPVVGGLIFLSPQFFLLARLTGSALALAINRRQGPVKFSFNLVQFVLTTLVEIEIVHLAVTLAPEFGPVLWAGVLLAILAENLISVTAVSVAITLAEGTNQFDRIPEMLRIGGVVSLTNASLALLGVAIAWERPVAGLLVVIPVLTAWMAYRAYIAERQQHQSIEMLYESTRILQSGPRLDAAIGAVLDHARRMFRAERAELFLLPSGDRGEILRSVVGPGDRAEAMLPVGQAFENSLMASVVENRRAIMLRSRDGDGDYRNAILAPLRGESSLFGLMVVADRLSEISPFDDSDLQLFELLANHTAVALENGRLEQSLTQLTELKEELRYQAFHDALTGLANRALFSQIVGERLASEQPAETVPAIMFIDLDDFKLVNDTLGHGTGDELLRAVATRLAASLREGDLAARLGGDEFAVLIEDDPSLTHSTRIADRLIASFDEGVFFEGHEVAVRASIGIAAGRPGLDRAEDAMRNADVAMYSAKAHGKARAEIFRPDMQMAMMTRAQLSTDLQRALVAREFVLEYQPIVNLASGRLVGVEALVRWDHPSRGRLAPDAFIHVAEESDTICQIGRWVLGEACARAGEWARLAGSDGFTVSVNVSAREFAAPDFVGQTLQTIRGHGLEPSSIVLEMTETAMLSDEGGTRERLGHLREAGVRVSVDDFGTGYSSLAYLRQFPVTTLKIARDFVGMDERDPESWALASAIVAMGQALGLDVIAEGVESEDQLTQLFRMGCAFAQGFYFARPLAADRIDALLMARARGIVSVRDAWSMARPEQVDRESPAA